MQIVKTFESNLLLGGIMLILAHQLVIMKPSPQPLTLIMKMTVTMIMTITIMTMTMTFTITIMMMIMMVTIMVKLKSPPSARQDRSTPRTSSL